MILSHGSSPPLNTACKLVILAPCVAMTSVIPATSPLRSGPLVVMTKDSKLAVVRDLSNNKVLHIGKGEKHQDWELTDISDNEVTFSRGGQNQILSLDTKKNNPAKKPPARIMKNPLLGK